MKYFRVKIGYGKDDFISVDETELAKALRAQIKGTVAQFKEGTVGGNHIVSITPDFQKAMGWSRDHELRSDDYAELGSKKVEEHRLFLEATKDEVRLELNGGTPTVPRLG